MPSRSEQILAVNVLPGSSGSDSFCYVEFNPVVLQNVVAAIDLNLPDAKQFGQDAYNLALPQILAFSAAVIGILAVAKVIQAFSRGG